MEGTVSVTVWFLAIVVWGWYAPKWSPFTRNVCAIVPCVADLVLFVVLRRYWKLSLVFLAIGAGVYWLTERFPKRPENRAERRKEVSFLQDMMFCAGGFWLSMQVFMFCS
ncbi:MAG: hypothetical protein K2I22_03675 [Lachnospiraceae bacterium]|nr:hypothetical protein [Lachnospiraceae bacterium]